MKNKIKILSLLAFLSIGLVSCGNKIEISTISLSSSYNHQDVSSTVASTSTSTSTNDLTSTSDVISSTTNNIPSSSESSTGENLLDYITGTPETRRETYMATEDMYMNTFWGVYLKAENYGYNYNLYFMDGSYGYRVKNIYDSKLVASLKIGEVYEVTGDVDISSASNPSTSGKENDVIFRLVENGSTKVTSNLINLATTNVSNSDQFALAYFDSGVVKTTGDKPIVTVNNVDYTLTSSGGTTEESAVTSLLSSLTAGQTIKLKQGVLDKNSKIKIISVTDIE